jgi:tetratricopeptide (TPR) repeat protein
MGEELLWIELGKIHIKLGSLDDAVTVFSRAIDINPTSGWAYYNLAFIYQQKGEFGKAVSLYRKCIPLIEDTHTQTLVWNKLGDTYLALRDSENAMAAYEKAIGLEMSAALPIKSPDADSKRISKIPLRQQVVNDPIKAGANTAQLQEKNCTEAPGELTPPESLGEKQKETNLGVDNEKEQAIDRFSLLTNDPRKLKSASINPSEVQGGTNASISENQIINSSPRDVGNKNSTTDDRVLEQNDNNQPNKEKNDPALEDILSKVHIYENITRANPLNDRAWDTLGKLYKTLGRFQDAIAAYQQAINLVPSKDVYYYYLGLLYAVEKQDDKAIQAFQDVLRTNPDYVLAHSALAGIYRRIGMEAKANQHISIAMPKIANESAYNRACFYAICGDHELAIEFLRLALKHNDTSLEWIMSDPDLDQIRPDQRFQALIEENKTDEKTDKDFFSASTESENNKFLELLNNSMER